MKIYIAHSRSFDYKTELYAVIKNSSLSKEHEFIFPHESENTAFDSKALFQSGCDLVIAEVSYPATGLGIELGWADMLHVPIGCVYKKGNVVSSSLSIVSDTVLEYSNSEELISKISDIIHVTETL